MMSPVTSTSVATNGADEVNYSRARPRALDAVVLLDAISRVTGVEEEFAWQQGARAHDRSKRCGRTNAAFTDSNSGDMEVAAA